MPRNSTTWQPGWNSGTTKLVRIPIALESPVMAYARDLDKFASLSDVPQRVRDISLILEAIAKYIDYKRANYHPNQNSRELDITTRSWDELRKFKKLLEENPQVLF